MTDNPRETQDLEAPETMDTECWWSQNRRIGRKANKAKNVSTSDSLIYSMLSGDFSSSILQRTISLLSGVSLNSRAPGKIEGEREALGKHTSQGTDLHPKGKITALFPSLGKGEKEGE